VTYLWKGLFLYIIAISVTNRRNWFTTSSSIEMSSWLQLQAAMTALYSGIFIALFNSSRHILSLGERYTMGSELCRAWLCSLACSCRTGRGNNHHIVRDRHTASCQLGGHCRLAYNLFDVLDKQKYYPFYEPLIGHQSEWSLTCNLAVVSVVFTGAVSRRLTNVFCVARICPKGLQLSFACR